MEALAIIGPTAVGKSRLALALAGTLDGEIVSIDSRQAYRRIDIGTAKPLKSDRARIPHHLIDMLELEEKNDAERFAQMARTAVRDIFERARLPILVGGSGLYLHALLHGFFDADLDPTERARFAESVERIPTPALFRQLGTVDPGSARRIHRNDRYRIVRALEVYTLTGVPLSEHYRRQEAGTSRERFDCRKIGLTSPRHILYERINERTKKMLECGWIEEVQRLIKEGADPAWPGLRSLGYPEVISFVRGEISLQETYERVTRLTRRYAKRQITWFSKVEGVVWFDALLPDLEERVLMWLRRRGE